MQNVAARRTTVTHEAFAAAGTRLDTLAPVLAGAMGFAITLACAHGRSTHYNNYVLFAQALLHGRLWIDWPGPYIDAVLFDGHRYIVNDPIPGLLMLPAVAFWGLNANQTFLACVLAGVSVGATWKLCRRLGCSIGVTTWLTAFAFAGTDLLWGSMLGDVWFIAQTAAFAFTVLTLLELAGPRRGWLTALYFALAIGSRFTLIMAVPAVAYWLATGFEKRENLNLRNIRFAALACLPFALAWVAYNLARWHVPWDSGHTIFYHEDNIGSAFGSPFSIAHVPMQLWSFFLQGPILLSRFPYVQPSIGGLALTLTSPALALAFVARRPARVVIGAWIAVVLVAAPSFLYYVNGYAQFGMRHALDFEPFLILLMACAAKNALAALWRVLITWSVAMGLWGTWYWNVFYRVGNR
jgi:hypothetical protein